MCLPHQERGQDGEGPAQGVLRAERHAVLQHLHHRDKSFKNSIETPPVLLS